MKKFTLFLTLFFAMAMTAFAQSSAGFEQQITAITVADATDAPVSADCTSGSVKVATFDVTASEAGDVTVLFDYTSGNHKLAILGIDLLNADGTVAYSDYHQGATGGSDSNNTYTITSVVAGDYTLRYFFCHLAADHEVGNQQATITVTGLSLVEEEVTEPEVTLGENELYIYHITAKDAARGAIYADATEGYLSHCGGTYNGYHHTDIAVDNTSEAQQFVFAEYDGKKYLYSLGAQMFAVKDGNFMKLSSDPEGFVTIEDADVSGYNFVKAEGTNKFNFSGGYSYGIFVNNESTDDGNCLLLTQVGTYDATELNASIKAYFEAAAAELAAARAAFDAAYADAGEILTAANLQTTAKEQLALQTSDANAAYYLWCNVPDPSEGSIDYLVNGNNDDAAEFFHSSWHPEVTADMHYLEVDLGTGNELSQFAISYHTRLGNIGNDFPDGIQIMGSNDGSEYTEIFNITSGLPQSANTSWASSVIGSQTAYRYLRFNITAERTYWHMSEFDITPYETSISDEYASVVNEIIALNAVYSAAANNTDYDVEALNTATSALNAALEAVVVEPVTEPFEVVSVTPSEAVESFQEIVIEFNKNITVDWGTGGAATGGTDGTATGGTDGTATGGTDGTATGTGTSTTAYQYLRFKDADGNNTSYYIWANDDYVTVEGNKLTLKVQPEITTSGEYTLEFPADVVTSEDGDVYEGATFTFTVDALPVISSPKSLSVVDDELATFDVTFSEAIKFATTSDVQTINVLVKDTETVAGTITVANNAVINGNVLTLTLDAPIVPELATTYTVAIPENWIVKESNEEKAFAGATLTYKVKIPLAINSITPTSGSKVSSLENIVIAYNYNTLNKYNTSGLKLINTADNSEVALTATVAENTLTLTPAAEVPVGTYTLSGVMNAVYDATNFYALKAEPEYTITVTEPLAVASVTPSEAVESFKEIVIEFNKNITVDWGTSAGTGGTGGTGGTDVGTGGTGGTDVGTGGTGGTSSYWYLKIKDANGGVAGTIWTTSDETMIVEGAKITMISDAEIATAGEYTLEFPAGVVTSEEGDVYEGATFTFTVVEPVVIYPAAGAETGTIAFVAEGASYEGESVTIPTGEIVGQTYSSDYVTLSHTQVSASNSQVNSSLVRWYKNDILTFTPAAGVTITGIVFNGVTSNNSGTPTASAGEVTAYDSATGTITWSGAVTEALTLTASASQVRFASVVVSYTVGTTTSTVAAPEFSVEEGTFYNPTTVELTAAEGATIYYVTDDSELSSEANVYEGAIAVDFGTTTIKAFAVVDGEASPVATATYTVAVAAPTFSVEPGVYASGLELTVSSATEGATVCLLSGTANFNKNVQELTYYYYKNETQTKNLYATTEFKSAARVITAAGDTLYSDSVIVKYYISDVAPYMPASAIESGKQFVMEYNSGVIAPLAESVSYGNPVTTEVTFKNEYIETFTHYAYTITAVDEAAGTYTIKDTFGRYLHALEGYSSINVAATMPETGAVWEITFNENGDANIKNVLTGTYLSYYSSKGSFNLYSAAADITLYAETEYPTFTTTPSGEYGEEVTSISSVTIACEKGLALNTAEDAPVVELVIDYNYDEPYYGTATLAEDGSYITVTFGEEFTANGNYGITIPAGMFYMDPEGLNTLNEEKYMSINIFVATPLEVVEVTPADDVVTAIDTVKVKFNQEVECYSWMAYITNDKDSTIILSQTDGDGLVPADEIWFIVTDGTDPVSITADGTYKFDLSTLDIYPAGQSEPLTFAAGAQTVYSWIIGTGTGIEGIEAENGENAVIYDLTGRRVEKITVSGIYIVNGKKVLVK